MSYLGEIRTLRAKIKGRMPILGASKRLAEKIILVDVGASQGLQRKWLPHRHNITPVLFEPNPDQAAALKGQLAPYGTFKIVPYGLSDGDGKYTLNISTSFGCSSLLKANMEFLADYEIAKYFRIERTAEVICVRYDELVKQGSAFAPDVIKIDVEGYETRVLDGFGGLLHDVLGIETEAWFYPGFKEQELLHDIITRLDRFGLRLRRIEEVSGFEGDLVCINAYFTMHRKKYRTLPANQREKFDLMAKVWALTAYA